MKHYRLTYLQPYEYDDDSPSGIGDHGINYSKTVEEFSAKSDPDAREMVRNYLKLGGVNFGSYPGSPPQGCYPRKFVGLVEFKPDRVVDFC